MNSNNRINLSNETSPAELLSLIRSSQSNSQSQTRNLQNQTSTSRTERIRFLLNTKICFLISSVINIVLSLAILLLFYTQSDPEISLDSLEDDGMFLIYTLIFIFSFISLWNIFLFISLTIFGLNFTEVNLEDTNKYKSTILFIDVLYFNPGVYSVLIYTFYKNFFPTNLDLLTWNLISAFYFLNFVFSFKLFFYTKLKVKYITHKNFYDGHGNKIKLPFNKIRCNELVLIIINLIFLYFISQAIRDTDITHKYLLMGKVSL